MSCAPIYWERILIKYFMSPQGWLALTISLILGGLIGYWTNSQFANRKSMVFSTKSINYISAFQTKIDGFSALFDGKPIENLTTTQLLFLNNGNQTIDGNDITQINPLLIKANNPKVKILRVNIIKSDKVNNLKVTKKNNKFLINFDFLDKDDGSIIQIIHSGKIDEDVTFLGTIKGITKLIKYILLLNQIQFIGLVL